jgi:hypothetical protein
MIQFIQKARQLKVLGFDSYQGIVATHGIDKADQILSYLLEASELGFNLNDLKTLFNNLSGVSDKKEEDVITASAPIEELPSLVPATLLDAENTLWQLIKERFGFTFDIQRFVNDYQSPSYPQFLEIEDFLMCLGVDWFSANSRMRGASGSYSTLLKSNQIQFQILPTLTTVGKSTRQVYERTNKCIDLILESSRKFLLKEYTPPTEVKMLTISEWLDARFALTRSGQKENWSLPKEVLVGLAGAVNNLLIKYNIGSEYVSKTHTTKDIERFTEVDALDVSKGFCEIVYRDVVMSLYNKDISFREMVQEFCSKKGIVYTKDFEDLVEDQAKKTKINYDDLSQNKQNQYDFSYFTLKSVKPFHQLVLFHLLEKVVEERNSLKVSTFS